MLRIDECSGVLVLCFEDRGGVQYPLYHDYLANRNVQKVLPDLRESAILSVSLDTLDKLLSIPGITVSDPAARLIVTAHREKWGGVDITEWSEAFSEKVTSTSTN